MFGYKFREQTRYVGNIIPRE